MLNPTLLKICILLLLLSAGFTACKKDAGVPADLRPSDFYASWRLVDSISGQATETRLAGEDIYSTSIGTYKVDYYSTGKISNQIKSLECGLNWELWPLFYIRFNHDDLATSGTAPEWSRAEIEAYFTPNRVFNFGDQPGQVELFAQVGSGFTGYTSASSSLNTGFVRIKSVSDYGRPEVGIQPFGKMIVVEFETLAGTDSLPTAFQLQNGYGVLFAGFDQ